MNKKKCPKCGEENPGEAVMCWACYTPLSGAAAAPAGAAPGAAKGSAPMSTGEETEKKKIPPWQLGVVGGGLLLVVGLGVKSMMPSSSSSEGDDDDGGDPPKTEEKKEDGGNTPAATAPTAAVVSPAPAGGGTVTVTPTEAPFTIVVPPNPKVSIATMAIVPTDATTSGPMAASYASYVRRQYSSSRWSTLYIYVFSDATSAQQFASIMKKRRGSVLEPSDYPTLSTLWSSALARYEYSSSKGKRVERVLYPSKNPNGWWFERS